MFRTGPILQIVLYLLKACLAVSLTRLSQYLVDQQPASPALLDTEREELRNSLVLTQESAAIQILLECCQEEEGELGRLSAVQETHSQVCCYLARMCRAFPPLIRGFKVVVMFLNFLLFPTVCSSSLHPFQSQLWHSSMALQTFKDL